MAFSAPVDIQHNVPNPAALKGIGSWVSSAQISDSFAFQVSSA